MSLDLEAYDKRRAAMLALLKVAAGVAPFATWVPIGETIGRSKSEKLELYLKVLYELLRDLLLLHEGTGEIRNQDIRRELEALAAKVQFAWIRKAVARVDEIAELIRRNIQKTIALDALIVELRAGQLRDSRQRAPEFGEARPMPLPRLRSRDSPSARSAATANAMAMR